MVQITTRAYRLTPVKVKGSVLDIDYSQPSFLWRYKRWFR